MITYIGLYIVTLITFLGVDSIWLTQMAPTFYKKHIGHLLAPEANLGVAGLFYAMYAIGIVVFCVFPAIQKSSWQHALVYGILFGFFTYTTYDFTNMATLKDWPLIVTVVDVLWGMILNGTTALIVYFISKKFLF